MPAMSSSVRIVPRFPAAAAQGVRLVDAAFRFSLLHPAVLPVIPAALWDDLNVQGLLREDAAT